MAKKLVKSLKLVIPAGKATPAPPIGPALGQAKVNIGEFVTRFNAGTKDRMGDLVPTIINTYDDKSFELVFKTSPASSLILKAIGKEKGSGKAPTEKAGTISKAKVREIAEKKMVDLNANTIEAAMKIIEGSARSMGVDVK
ncbi:MAG: 50S ribosomal protein L11 [Patescibacteria group bacterium]